MVSSPTMASLPLLRVSTQQMRRTTTLLTTSTAMSGLQDAYNLEPELALALSTIAVAISGDPLTTRWSIGGAFSPAVPLFPATGLVGTHNQYESDASIVRVRYLFYSDVI